MSTAIVSDMLTHSIPSSRQPRLSSFLSILAFFSSLSYASAGLAEEQADAGSPPAEAAEGDEHVADRADQPSELADDDGGGVARASTRPLFANFAIGPSIGLVGCNEAGCDDANAFDQLKLTQEIGYHVSGGGDGFAIGFSIDEAFGDHVLRVQPGAKFLWDIQPSEDHGFYIAPFVKAGYSYLKLDAGPFGSATEHAFNGQAGVEARLVLGDRALLYLRPVGIDVLANDDGVLMMYDIMISGGITF
jgi:hypothetical protein